MPADAEDAAAEPAQCDAPKSLAAIAVTQKLELMELRPMLRNQALLMVFKQTLHRQKLCQLKVLHDLKYGMLECYEQRHSRDAKELVASAEEKLTFQVQEQRIKVTRTRHACGITLLQRTVNTLLRDATRRIVSGWRHKAHELLRARPMLGAWIRAQWARKMQECLCTWKLLMQRSTAIAIRQKISHMKAGLISHKSRRPSQGDDEESSRLVLAKKQSQNQAPNEVAPELADDLEGSSLESEGSEDHATSHMDPTELDPP